MFYIQGLVFVVYTKKSDGAVKKSMALRIATYGSLDYGCCVLIREKAAISTVAHPKGRDFNLLYRKFMTFAVTNEFCSQSSGISGRAPRLCARAQGGTEWNSVTLVVLSKMCFLKSFCIPDIKNKVISVGVAVE